MVARIWAKLQTLYVSIHTTYPANFIETTDMVQQKQQFKFCSSLFRVNMQLHFEYSRVTNQTFPAFHQQFKRFSDKYQLPIAHSVFKPYLSSVQNVHQL